MVKAILFLCCLEECKLAFLKGKYQKLQTLFLQNQKVDLRKKKAICSSFMGLVQGCETWAKVDTVR
ncbi:hypothetical protein A33Q_3408 [Indibacter alkaliphilus LW1]|uniref:Uncharacterized protein n=1 Tax=Indibacter alkaliphilus (strain CCUG 57479 / KCTC 22604 / LW1) TaxID=1189612 RepID=S2DZG5_INDAL|nr:hypothetical protein [Indibacter alkaliphilus]EOZ95203.1 hypothetical protein A33Q_3408 [Indibacter alkaliphilus LW1]